MRSSSVRRACALVSVAVLGLGLSACGGSSGGGSATAPDKSAPGSTTGGSDFTKASGSVRGFDGTTVNVASLGIKGQLPGVEVGAQARIKRFNDDAEIKGVKLNYLEFADDKVDPATALSEGRRLVTAEKAFAIVGDVSPNNPVDYFKQQKVPYFGWAFDNTYCAKAPSTDLWGFGIYGCLVPEDPPEMPDQGTKLFKYVTEKTGKDKPTAAVFSNDTTSGRNSSRLQSVAYAGAGFDIVLAKGIVPPPPVSDYTPYVQQLLTSDGGKAPDVIVCLLSTDCIPIWKQLQANSYKGVYFHTLYSDALLAAMQGTVTSINFHAFNESTPALDTMKADVAAIKADQALDTGVSTGYFSADMFIQALKTVAKQGKGYITPENVQKAASTMTWAIKDLVGPVRYPDATVKATPYCNALVENSDGKAWKTVVPFSCSEHTYPVK